MSNCLDPGQARHFVGPDLGPKCLQMLSAVDTSMQEVYPFCIPLKINVTKKHVVFIDTRNGVDSRFQSYGIHIPNHFPFARSLCFLTILTLIEGRTMCLTA